MRVVLYAEDMEPITVLELPDFAVRHIEQHGRVRLPVYEPVQAIPCRGDIPLRDLRIVSIYAERIVRKGVEHTLLFTGDDESALLLRAAFLPGQQRTLQDREKDAFAKGFLRAISSLG